MKTEELRTVYSHQKSFYKKAFIKVDDDNTEYMYSYYNLMVTNYGKALKFEEDTTTFITASTCSILKFEEDTNLYSLTTMKHLREYLRQVGRWDLATLSKSKLLKRLERTNYIIVDILE